MPLSLDQETSITRAHIRHLESRVNDLQGKFSSFARQSPYHHLIVLIRQPGWTTVAEARFFEDALDSLDAKFDALTRDQQNLLKAARLVGRAARD